MRKNWAIMILTTGALLAVFFLTFHLHQESKEKVLSQFNENQVLNAQEIARSIERYFHSRSQDLRWLAYIASRQAFDRDKMPAAIRSNFNRLKLTHIQEVALLNEKGTVVFSTTAGAKGKNHSQADFFSWARNPGSKGAVRMWCAKMDGPRIPITAGSPAPPPIGIFLATPLYRESAAGGRQRPGGKFAGALMFTVDLAKMLAERSPMLTSSYKFNKLWIMERGGTLLVHSGHPEMVMRNVRKRDGTCNQCHASFDYVERILGKAEGATEYQINGGEKKKVAAFASMSFGNASWIVVVNAPLDEVTAFEREHLKTTLFLLGAVVFLLGLVFFSAYRNYRQKVASEMEVTRFRDQQKLTEELRESEARYRTVAQSANDAIITVNGDGTIMGWNMSAERMFGYPEAEVLRQPLATIMPSQFRERHRDGLKRVQADGEKRVIGKTVELAGLRKDGSEFPLELSLSHWEIPDGHFYTGIIRDITDRKRAEEEKRSLEERLHRAEKMEALGQLAGGVAHDLNNVLGVLSGYSELLLGEIPEGSRSRSHAEKILQSTEKGAAIIRDLLTLARRGVTVSDVINLNSVVSDFLQTPVFEKMKDYNPRVTFRTECDKNMLNIKGSSIHLEKTLMNLVSNAAESISGIGEVTIRTESRYLDKPLRGYDEVKEGDYAVLTVSDTGMGIPAENREKIFEPFYTKKTMGRSGTGLGLAIVWGTVKDHNGYIDVETKVGEGTTFTLYFPVTREELIAPQQKPPIERYMAKGESVLVVDDIAGQRDIAARLLTRLGYQVHVVSSGEEAVEYLKGNKAEILVLDMIMAPGIDGLETYQRVLEINPKQKAILVSGFSETERVKETQQLGAGAYVKKPYVLEKIGGAIRDELNR